MELAENQLTGAEIKHLKKYASSLEVLKLASNKITDWKDVEQLSCFKKLKNLDLENNEVAKIDGYKEKVWALFEGGSLEILDNHNKAGEEAFSEELDEDDYGSSLDDEQKAKFMEDDFYGNEGGFEGGEDDMDDLENDSDEDENEGAEANKRAKH